VESSSTLPSLGARFSGESLDPVGSGDGRRTGVTFLLWGVALKSLLPSMPLVGMDAHDIVIGRWLTGDASFPCGGLRDNDDSDESWFGHGNDFGSRLLFRCVLQTFALVFPCCEVGAAVAITMVTMPCGGLPGPDGPLWRESCISHIRSSSSESELPASGARSHMFGIGLRGLHEAIAARSSLVVVLR
jgi:hypothetical protein